MDKVNYNHNTQKNTLPIQFVRPFCLVQSNIVTWISVTTQVVQTHGLDNMDRIRRATMLASNVNKHASKQ